MTVDAAPRGDGAEERRPVGRRPVGRRAVGRRAVRRRRRGNSGRAETTPREGGAVRSGRRGTPDRAERTSWNTGPCGDRPVRRSARAEIGPWNTGPCGDRDVRQSGLRRSGRERLVSRWRDDRGSASIWLLAAGVTVLLIGLGVAQAGAAMVARHQAQEAADLGALAGARQWYAGAEVACARAGALVVANHARLADCVLDGPDLVVVAEVQPAGPMGGLGPARAAARAGPVRGSLGAGT